MLGVRPSRLICTKFRNCKERVLTSKATFFCFFMMVVGFSGTCLSADLSSNLKPQEDAIEVDKEVLFPKSLIHKVGPEVVPDLAEQRAQRNQKNIQGLLPVPGGLGAGVSFRPGGLQVTRNSDLRTVVFVYPDGLALPPNWLYQAATNRTKFGVEVVVIYFGGKLGSLGIYDWSCRPDFPCENSRTVSSWQWIKPLNDLPCYMQDDLGMGGSKKDLRYSNQTIRLKAGNPGRGIIPLWKNKVKLWNYCDNTFDVVYTHKYRVEQPDCSLDSSCGWWGPILETFFRNPQPPIQPLGFSETALIVDGKKYLLTASNTKWKSPARPWVVISRTPNHSWIIGTDIDSIKGQLGNPS